MLKTPLNFRMALAAALAIAGGAVLPAVAGSIPTPAARRPSRSRGISRSYNRSGRHYPEQSSRQALRGHCRAQGGFGIQLVDGVYQPKVSP